MRSRLVLARPNPALLAFATLALVGAPWDRDATSAEHTQAEHAQKAAAQFRERIQPLLANYCYGCHGDGGQEGGLALDRFSSDEERLASKTLWWKVLKNVRADIMPPAGEPRPSAEEKETLAEWIREGAFGLDPKNPDPGRVTVRRLNRIEYQNTIRDLMGVEFNTDVEFPPDDTGHGFDNLGDVLSISPLLMEKYLHAAEEIVGRAVPKQTLVMPVVSLDGGDFRREQAGGQEEDNPKQDPQEDRWRGSGRRRDGGGQLPFYEANRVSAKARLEHAGSYRVLVETSVSSGFDFEPGRCEVQCSLDDRPLFAKVYAWQSGQQATYNYEFEAALAAGEHEVAFSLKPLVPQGEGESALSFRIGEVRLEGPLDPKYWKHPEGYDRFFPRAAPPEDRQARREYAREILQAFAARAYRRPVDDPHVDRLVEIAEVVQQRGGSFEAGIGRAITAVLVSPRFLFRVEKPAPQSTDRFPLIDEFSLASRLSYLFWATMPDGELIELASRGELRANLDQQIERMMDDPRSQALIQNFVGHWLQTRDVDAVTIDPQAASGLQGEYEELRALFATEEGEDREPGPDDPPERIAAYERYQKVRDEYRGWRNSLDAELRGAMRQETELLFEYVAREDRDLLELLDADYTFLNERLARHYGIEGVTGDEMRRVELRPEHHRGGVLTQASFLMVTSNPIRTSPVKRGLFILENILGTPAPPPPPDVPDLDAAKEEAARKNLTLRQLLEVHRSDHQCSSCHARFDPLGLALENYTAMGTWRDLENKQPIDPSGQLITGESFENLGELKRILTGSRKRDFYRCFAERFLTFALGRGLEYYDEQTLSDLVAQLEEGQGRFSVFLHGVVHAAPFQRQRRAADDQALSNVP